MRRIAVSTAALIVTLVSVVVGVDRSDTKDAAAPAKRNLVPDMDQAREAEARIKGLRGRSSGPIGCRMRIFLSSRGD